MQKYIERKNLLFLKCISIYFLKIKSIVISEQQSMKIMSDNNTIP